MLLYVQYPGLVLLTSLAIISLYLQWRGVTNIRFRRICYSLHDDFFTIYAVVASFLYTSAYGLPSYIKTLVNVTESII